MTQPSRRAWTREPLLHFVILGGLAFAVARWAPQGRTDVVRIGEDHIARAVAEFERSAGRSPTAEERAGLIEVAIDEELLYREGLRLGLDENDPVIRQRVIKKVDFIITEQASAAEPDDATLQAFIDEQPERFTGRERADFVLVSFGGADADAQAQRAATQLEAGAAPREVGGRAATASRFTLANTARTYGQAVADAVAAAEDQRWHVIEIPGGAAALRVVPSAATGVPPLDKVRQQARHAYQRAQQRQALRRHLDALRTTYTIEVAP